MTDFNALLKRSYAEAPEPADDGFTVRIAHAVDRREKAAKVRQVVWALAMAVAGTAVASGLYQVGTVFGPELMASVGLEVARAHGAIANAPSVSGVTQGLVQSLGAGFLQVALIATALAGGALAYRQSQE
ncbi:MAG: hypothetical protein R3C16_07885 [Hyphomonadaceae bacterium]